MDKLKGDVKHNLSPVLGWLRLAIHDDTPLTPGQMVSAEAKLSAIMALIDTLPDSQA